MITMCMMVITLAGGGAMSEQAFNIAEAKRRLSDLVGRVAYGGETVVIMKRGRPVAKLVPLDASDLRHLAEPEGWLDDDDPFFGDLEAIVDSRQEDLGRSIRFQP